MASSFLIPFDGGANTTAEKKTNQTNNSMEWPKIVSIQSVECTYGRTGQNTTIRLRFFAGANRFREFLLDLSVDSHISAPPFHMRVSAYYSLYSFACYILVCIRHSDLFHLVFLFSFDSRLVFDAEEEEKQRKKHDCKHIRFVKSFRFWFFQFTFSFSEYSFADCCTHFDSIIGKMCAGWMRECMERVGHSSTSANIFFFILIVWLARTDDARFGLVWHYIDIVRTKCENERTLAETFSTTNA